MKIKYLLFKLLIILAFTATKTFAQAPQQFNYQGAARNANGTPLSNRQISLRISILDGSATGSAQYVETRTVTTNQLGLYNFAIGSAGALSTSGTIAGVKWADGLKYIKVEIDPNNGSAFTLAGTAQLLSVPYALYAGNSSGSAASTILNGNGAPSTTTGKDGDFYIDNVANMIFGPKASGSWPAGKNIVGPKGDKGDAGVDGAKGDTGIKGDKGDKGDAGQGGVTNAGSDIDVSGTGVVADPYIISSKITGANGLTKTGSNIELGGSVTKNTTLAIDAGKTLAITGLTTGTGGENIMVVDGTTGVVKSVAPTTISADNGLTKTGNNFQLGGALTGSTVITTDAAKTLAIKGLQTGTGGENIMVVDGTTGVVKSVAPTTISADNGLTKTGNNFQLGGALTGSTVITTDAAKTLAIKGLQTGTGGENIMVVDGTTGVVKSVAPTTISADNGLTKTGNNFQLGGALTGSTVITTDAAKTLAIKGLQTGTGGENIMVVDGTTGVVKSVAQSSLVSANNGLTKTGDNIELGGSVTKNTTLAIDAGKTLAITGLTTGTGGENIMVVDGTTGVVKSVAPTTISADNGLTKTGNNFQLGGALTGSTVITTDAAKTLAIKGLQTGTGGENIMVVDGTTGVVKSVAPTTISADNGLTKTGNNFQLGGALTGSTVITTDAAKTLAIKGLQTGTGGENIMVVDGTTGVVKSVAPTTISADNGLTKTGNNFQLGGALTGSTVITTDAAKTLAIKGLQTGTGGENIMVVDGTTGVVKSVAQSSLVSANNGLTKTGDNIELGGSVTKNTTLAIDAGKTLAITGLTTGTGGENIMVVDGTTGVVKSVAPTTISADNGLTKTGNNFQLGGALTGSTVITTDAAKTLAIKGLQTGTGGENIMVVDGTTGVVKSVAPTTISADNGLTKTGNNFQLGGALTGSTVITTDAAKTLAIKGLQTGTGGENIMVVDGTTGVVKSVAQSSLVSANNGLTKTGDNIELGGSVTKNTTLAIDAGKTLAITGLTTGTGGENIMVVDGTTGVVKSVAPTTISADNGLTKTGNNFQLGGALTGSTVITTDAAKTLAIKGLQTGTGGENIMVVDGTTGVVKSVAPTTISADNGLTKTGNNFQLGGALTGSTVITTDAAKTLAIKGLQTGTGGENIMVVDGTTGVVKSVAQSSLVSANNGLTKTGDNIELGGSVTKNTTLAIDAGKTLAITGLTTGTGGENIMVVDGTTGVVKSVAPTTISADNGLTKTGNNFQLGGALTGSTVITTDAAKTLAIKGLQTGTGGENIMVVDGTTGVVKSVAPTTISADNGLTKTGNNFQLGGALTGSTVITTDAAKTLAIKGLQTGTGGENIMVVDGTTGVVKSVAQSSLVSANNGLTKTGDNIELGGSVTKNTTLAIDAGKTLAITGLTTGTGGENIMVVDGTTGVVKSVAPTTISADNGLTKTGNNFQLGGALTGSTVITTDAAKTLAIKGLQTGTGGENIMVVDGTTGVVKSVAPTTISADNGLTKTGNNFQLGGSLTGSTVITTDAAKTLAIKGLQTGTGGENIMVVDGTTGVVKSLAPSTITANSWSLSGNAGTNPATQFLGTSDAQPLVLRTNNVEQLRVTSAGNVGIGTTTPNTKLEVSSGSAGNSGFRLTNLTNALTTSTRGVATLGVNANGDVVVMNTATTAEARNIINMPSVAIDISTAGTFTLDLYNAYKTQYNTPPVASAGAPTAIPTVAAATDFYYYVTYYDNNVFTNLSITAAGVLTYTVTTNAVSSATFMNIVLVPKN